jgi:DNA modification methylase
MIIWVKEHPALPRKDVLVASRREVLDLFGGSGSTLIAAEKTGRRAFLMELDAPYADVIVRRWEELAGRKTQRLEAAAVETEA